MVASNISPPLSSFQRSLTKHSSQLHRVRALAVSADLSPAAYETEIARAQVELYQEKRDLRLRASRAAAAALSRAEVPNALRSSASVPRVIMSKADTRTRLCVQHAVGRPSSSAAAASTATSAPAKPGRPRASPPGVPEKAQSAKVAVDIAPHGDPSADGSEPVADGDDRRSTATRLAAVNMQGAWCGCQLEPRQGLQAQLRPEGQEEESPDVGHEQRGASACRGAHTRSGDALGLERHSEAERPDGLLSLERRAAAEAARLVQKADAQHALLQARRADNDVATAGCAPRGPLVGGGKGPPGLPCSEFPPQRPPACPRSVSGSQATAAVAAEDHDREASPIGVFSPGTAAEDHDREASPICVFSPGTAGAAGAGSTASTAPCTATLPAPADEYQRAARAVLQADFLLIAAGAGFSADSGLPVYNGIADVPAYSSMGLTYADLCQPIWARRDAEILFGFWGSCYNSYFDAAPHEGYRLLKRWSDAVVGKALLSAAKAPVGARSRPAKREGKGESRPEPA